MKKERITPQQIVDDFFHEYQEGRLDRDIMIVSILNFAKQYADERDAFNEERELNKAEYTCYYCDENASCKHTFDAYNIDGDCLAVK
jgi:hypothetical protein